MALARALAPSPSMLLLDEPLSALDAQVRVHLRGEIRALQQRLRITTIMVTHDQEEALTMADRIVLIDDGRLVQCDTPQVIYQAPGDPFAAGFIGAMNFMDGWEVVDGSTVRNGPWTLTAADGALKPFRGRKISVAIRPEDIRILGEGATGANAVVTRVGNIEFRGAAYRLQLRFQGQDPGAAAPEVVVDLAAEKLDRLGITKDSLVSISLPPERLLFF